MLEDDFDDGDSDGWTINKSPASAVTWSVSQQDAHSDPYSLQASNQLGVVFGSGWTTADSPPFPMDPSGDGSLMVRYFRTLVGGGLSDTEASLTVLWQYRTAEGATWLTAEKLEDVMNSGLWEEAVFAIEPPGGVLQVRIRFYFQYSCSQPQGCDMRANIDDFRMGWDGCM